VQTAFRYAWEEGYELAVRVDGDAQHDASQLGIVIAPVLAGETDIAVGSRFLGTDGYRSSAARRVGIRVLAWVVSTIARQKVTDPTSGFQALGRDAFLLCCEDFYPSDFPDVDVLLLLHRHGLRIVEVPVTMAQSPPGRVAMHAGLRAVYYPYKMLLSTFRSAFAPKETP